MNDEQLNPEAQEKVLGLMNTAINYRSMYEPRWYASYNAYENNHFVVWLPESKQIQKVPIQGNKFFNQVPEITKQVDTRENMLLATEIVPVVYPVKMDEPSTYWAEKIGDYLMYLYKHWMFNGVLHDAVHDAMVMPVSYLQLLPPQTNDGKMEIIELDAFDVFVMPGIKDVQSKDCMFVGKSIKHPVEEIQFNPNYNEQKKLVRGSESWSKSPFKDQIISERFSQGGASQKKAKTAVINEMWLKEFKADGTLQIRVITECEGKILRDELTPYKKLPFVSLKLHQGILYQPSFVEYLLPSNRSIDLLNSRMEDMALKMVRGALLAQYGSNITRTTDQNGEIMYWRLSKPDIVPVPEMPPFFQSYINSLFGLAERYGASAVTMGTSPKGVKTYRTVEAIRQQDYASIKIPMDFMKIALTQLFNLVIHFASMYYLEPVNVKIYEREDYNVFDVIGASGLKHNMDLFEEAKGDQTKAPVVIHEDNIVEVEFESAQSYTMEGKRQTIFEAVKNGLLGKEDAIRMLKLGNVRDIMANLEKESQQDAAQKIAEQTAQEQMSAKAAAGAEGGGAGATDVKEIPSDKAALGGNPAPTGGSALPGIRVGQ